MNETNETIKITDKSSACYFVMKGYKLKMVQSEGETKSGRIRKIYHFEYDEELGKLYARLNSGIATNKEEVFLLEYKKAFKKLANY